MKFRKRQISRLAGYDYSSNSCYFVTTCVNQRYDCLATIKGNRLVLTELGEIVLYQMYWLEKRFPYVEIRRMVIMPDHIHILIKYTGYYKRHLMKIKPLSEIIGALKMTSSKQIHLNGYWYFRWQSRFYDSIIRNKNHYRAVDNYIRNNPIKYLKQVDYFDYEQQS